MSKYNLNFLMIKAQENNGLCLSNKFIKYSTKYPFKCENNHCFFTTIKALNLGFWCNQCARIKSGNNKRKNIDYLIELADNNRGKCLSTHYITTSTKYNWQCENLHIWSATANNIQRGKWCPICKESHGERKIRSFLEKYNISFIRQHIFKDCHGNSKKKKALPFDFYIPEHNICIEYDGEQHFKPIKSFGGFSGFEKCQFHDKIKTEYCKANNIQLTRISFHNFNQIDQILLEIVETIFYHVSR